MIVRRFLAWAQSAPEDPRVSAAAALTRAFLSEETCVAERTDAEAAMTLLLDDPSPAVRLALAETLAESELAPRHIVSVLAAETGRTGEILLEHSPVLGEADLIERIATGDAGAQSAVARRFALPGPVAAALAEVGEAEAILALASNKTAECPDFAVTRMIERYGADPTVREALEQRALSVTQRYALHVVSAKASFAAMKGQASWRLERAERESAERVALSLAAQGEHERAQMVEHLRGVGHLTASLLLRAAAQADSAFVADALANLSKMNRRRVGALVAESKGSGFAALCVKAGLSQAVITALRAALEAHRDIAARGYPVGEASRAREACRSTLAACQAAGFDTHDVASMFRRLELEFSREAARVAAEKLLEQHRLETEGPLLLGAPMLGLPAPAEENAAIAEAAEAEEETGLQTGVEAPPLVAEPEEFAVEASLATGTSASALDQAFGALKAALEPFGPADGPPLDASLRPDEAEAMAERDDEVGDVRDWAAVLAATFEEAEGLAPVEAPAPEMPPAPAAQEPVDITTVLPEVPDQALETPAAFVAAAFLAEYTAAAEAAPPQGADQGVPSSAPEVETAAAGAVVDIPSPQPPAPARRAFFTPAQPDLSTWERVFDRADELAALDSGGQELQRETMAEMLREAVEAMQQRGGAVEVTRDRAPGVRAA